jgi:hypothetical protein
VDYRIFGFDAADGGIFARYERARIKAVVSGQVGAWIRQSQASGLGAYICSGAFGCSDSRHFCRSIRGEALSWFNSGCPNSEFLRQKNLADIARLAAIPGIRGIIIDGARFASPASGTGIDAFFTGFCDICQQKMTDLGFDAAAIRDSARAFHDCLRSDQSFQPARHLRYLRDWLEFRRICITDHFLNVRRTLLAADRQLEFGAYIFTPLLCRLVGQDYGDLAHICDFLSPMIYRHYREEQGPACLDHELRTIAAWFEDKPPAARQVIIETFQELAGVDFSAFGSPARLRAEGVPPELVGRETARACDLARGTPVIPIILLEDDRLADSLAACRQAPIGMIDLFLYEKTAFGRAWPLLQND